MRTEQDDAFIDDGDNHSQGDQDYSQYMARCINVIDVTEEGNYRITRLKG